MKEVRVKIEVCDYLTKKYNSFSLKKNSHNRILEKKNLKNSTNTVLKSCFI